MVVLRAILVVDPDDDYRRWLRTILTDNGSPVVGGTGEAEEAMRMAATTTPDVAVVAADLGQADGVQLANRLATEHGIPTVLLGPRAEQEVIARAAQGGAMGFLLKPVDAATLRATLEVAVSRFREILALQRWRRFGEPCRTGRSSSAPRACSWRGKGSRKPTRTPASARRAWTRNGPWPRFAERSFSLRRSAVGTADSGAHRRAQREGSVTR